MCLPAAVLLCACGCRTEKREKAKRKRFEMQIRLGEIFVSGNASKSLN